MSVRTSEIGEVPNGTLIFVGDPGDPDVPGPTTAADYVLASIDGVEQRLDSLAKELP
jgi:hypothetical protein